MNEHFPFEVFCFRRCVLKTAKSNSAQLFLDPIWELAAFPNTLYSGRGFSQDIYSLPSALWTYIHFPEYRTATAWRTLDADEDRVRVCGSAPEAGVPCRAGRRGMMRMDEWMCLELTMDGRRLQRLTRSVQRRLETTPPRRRRREGLITELRRWFHSVTRHSWCIQPCVCVSVWHILLYLMTAFTTSHCFSVWTKS